MGNKNNFRILAISALAVLLLCGVVWARGVIPVIVGQAVSGGGGTTPTISYVNKNGTVGKSTSLTGVTSGNLIVCMLQWQDTGGTPTLSDGTNAPDAYSNVNTRSNALNTRIAYWISSPKSGTVTYTWTNTGGGGYTAYVYEMSYTGTCSLISGHINLGTNDTGTTATSLTSPSTSETVMVAFGAGAQYTDATLSSATIDGVSVDQSTHVIDSGYAAGGSFTMRILNNPGTYAASFVYSQNNGWVADIIGFKVN